MRINENDLDLALTFLFNLLYILFIMMSPLNETPLRIVLGLPLVFFLPGYSLIAMLFPKKDYLGGIERFALSFGLSIAIVSLIGLALNYTPFGIKLTPVLIVISTFTISLTLLAWVRRMKLQREQRYIVPFESLLKAKSLFLHQTIIDKILSIILFTSIIASSTMLVYVVIAPKTGEKFTEFYILGPNGTASNYPKNLNIGEEGKVIIGIVNHEYENIIYRLEVIFNGSLIHEEQVFLIENEKWESNFTFKATKIGENKKLEFIIYKGQQIESYRILHLWIDVVRNE